MATFTPFSGTGSNAVASALLAPGSGISIVAGSTVLDASGPGAVNFYDGSLAPLGIGAGVLLTSGTTPGTANTVGWFGQDNSATSGFDNGSAQIDAVVNTVFQTSSYDATTLAFDFTVSDPGALSVSFDLVFGSDEYPEWVDQFVDCAMVRVNGVNYALFNHDPLHPLSVVSANLAAGYFQDNAANVLPIEYDGVSHVLKIVAPIHAGAINHIEIGIADTGDHIYDSGIFLSNFAAGAIPGSGVVMPGAPCDASDNTVTGSAKDEYFDLQAGNDVAYAGAGDDIVVGGSGKDTLYGGSGADQLQGDAGDDWLDGSDGADTAVYAGNSTDYAIACDGATGAFTITDLSGPAQEGTDTVSNVELAQFADGLFSLSPTGLAPVLPVAPPANTAGSVTIAGVGAPGKTLTATVSDVDGVPPAVDYQWQVSADGGATWSDVGAGGQNYTVASADAGKMLQVLASYTDQGGQAELATSTGKNILSAGNGDLVVTLMQLTAPAGSATINPLTTLVQDAIELGLTPNMASATIKGVLGLPAGIALQSYDAYAALQANPFDATALAVEKVAVQVAILTSLSDDDTGLGLTLAILGAAAQGKTLDLGSVGDLSQILGIAPVLDAAGKYPQPLDEILDRNRTISEGIADGAGVGIIEAEWQDLLSIQDGIASTSIADLSIHVNQAPVGTATASLAGGLVDQAYLLQAGDLLQGFSDPEGDALSVVGLTTDQAVVTDNGDGSFTIAAAAGYAGPVELSYWVADSLGAVAAGSQLLVIQANSAPTGSPTATLAAGTEDLAYVVSAADLLQGFSDADGDVLDVAGLVASNGSVAANGDGTFTITPAANYNGSLILGYDVVDGHGGSTAATLGFVLGAVNDGPTGAPGAALPGGLQNAPYTVSAAALLAGFSDVDGDALAVAGLAASNGVVVDNHDGTFTLTPTPEFSGTVWLAYQVVDGQGGSLAATQQFALSPVNLKLIGTADADLMNGGAGADVLYGRGADDVLAGAAGNDILHGEAGNDTLDGGAGDDRMYGGTGDDTYFAGSARDVAIESTNAGMDTVIASVRHTLRANLENLVLAGTDKIAGTGNALANVLQGNGAANTLAGLAGDDRLDGGGGNDLLIGGAGNDVLWGGAGADLFRFGDQPLDGVGNVDRIMDFAAIDDTLQLDNAVFTSFAATGTMKAASFRAGAGVAAVDADDFVLYDTATGTLSYDADGSGAAEAVAFATLVGAPVITAADLVVM